MDSNKFTIQRLNSFTKSWVKFFPNYYKMRKYSYWNNLSSDNNSDSMSIIFPKLRRRSNSFLWRRKLRRTNFTWISKIRAMNKPKLFNRK